ncbi:glycosyltransferase family 2 protein [Denitromonas halophila]|uniref:Glycosyltransferase family 2 protein n=1 Tax=Denitromonas halophila TaxID=1629404 RepID=A0A557QXH6_9RHOO|nr:glycosyltransferase family 2 protein [Denitromonas halophila]TVO57620.1 glycosyltransferase family 2 protein [Denitromonas halophila]
MSAADVTPKAYIVLVNWCNPFDTLECVQSLLQLDYPDFRVVVCDNGSTDNSMDVFHAWAEGRMSLCLSRGTPGERYATLPCEAKPPTIGFLDAQIIDGAYSVPADVALDIHSQFVFVRIPENLGFAGGNNVGLRYAQQAQDGDIYWLLNNDTVVDPASLSLISKKFGKNPACGMVGTTIFHYIDSGEIQYACGAEANKWLATIKPVLEKKRSGQSVDHFELAVEKRVSYVSGASLAISARFIDRVGFMEEIYFLYYEELDWAVRMPPDLRIGYASEAVVYHKEGAVIGGKTVSSGPKGYIAEHYSARNKIIFTRKHKLAALLPVVCMVLLSALSRVLKGRFRNAGIVVSALIEGLKA